MSYGGRISHGGRTNCSEAMGGGGPSSDRIICGDPNLRRDRGDRILCDETFPWVVGIPWGAAIRWGCGYRVALSLSLSTFCVLRFLSSDALRAGVVDHSHEDSCAPTHISFSRVCSLRIGLNAAPRLHTNSLQLHRGPRRMGIYKRGRATALLPARLSRRPFTWSDAAPPPQAVQQAGCGRDADSAARPEERVAHAVGRRVTGAHTHAGVQLWFLACEFSVAAVGWDTLSPDSSRTPTRLGRSQ